MKFPTKKLLAGVAAAATLLSGMAFAGGAIADETVTEFTAEELAVTQSITVTASDDTDISAKTLVAIPLAYYSSARYVTYGDGEREISGFDVESVSADYDAAIGNALEAAGIDMEQVAEEIGTSGNYMVWVVQNLLDSTDSPWSGQLRLFLDALKNDSTIAGAAGVGTWASTTDGSTNSRTVSGLIPGVYMIVDRTAEGQASIVMMNGTGIDGATCLQGAFTLGDVTYKIHGISVDNKIIKGGNNGGKGNGDFIGDDATSATEGSGNETSIGRKVTFQLETKCPNWIGYDAYYLSLNDTLSRGLTFVPGSVKVTVRGTELTEGKNYQVVTDGATAVTQDKETSKEYAGGSSFNVVFGQLVDGAFVQSIAGDYYAFPPAAEGHEVDIVVTYDAWVNKNAVIGYPGNPNIVEVEYSHNPGHVDEHKKVAADSATRTYVSGFAIVKTDMQENSLAGAEFRITQKDPITEAVNTLQFVRVDETHYRLADHTETTGTTGTIVSGTNGLLFIEGLDGEYTITETKSPFDNPILPEFSIKVTAYKAQDGKYQAAFTAEDANGMVSLDDIYIFRVRNARNLTEMPKTGAVWLCIYMVAGLLCVGGGMTLMRARKR